MGDFDFGTLAMIVAIGMIGPLLALPKKLRAPVVVGELAAGIAFGHSGLGLLNPDDPTFRHLADIGFALVMFLVGSHVPIRDRNLRSSVPVAALRCVLVGVAALLLAAGIEAIFQTGHMLLYAVLIASSSAALALPMIDRIGMAGPAVLSVTAQIAIADTACIVLLPLAIDPPRAGTAALGALAIAAFTLIAYFVIHYLQRKGYRKVIHRYSEQNRVALELRIALLLLFGLCWLAVSTRVSIMLAGFALGLGLSAIGQPRRLARQLFGVTEGFFGPLFFVWLGASLHLAELGEDPSLILLGLSLGAAAMLAHLAGVLTRQPAAMAVLASGQLGVPVAAAALGVDYGLMSAGEPSALILGALVTVVGTSIAANIAQRARNASAAGQTGLEEPDRSGDQSGVAKPPAAGGGPAGGLTADGSPADGEPGGAPQPDGDPQPDGGPAAAPHAGTDGAKPPEGGG
ncbi:cation:proton antiporter [Mycolicibacterium brumae]|uniref:Sodium:proton antiporter n=1 Tax=Mycolicibacterium brumae TaxID=85968 RepID=A0A2G5P9P7_9MYCO|nr:cation:proton antiporter [Mycolicibacterium brumae]PIB74790.1 sodium:proton antiporter [Mycolicibacterium brumae]RWA22248.1 hypothetical protein MBRU_13225 [Mycolicibacterium brumae DSM 44177]